VSFVEPLDGAVVSGEFKVVMDVRGMKLMPAGEVVEGAGHHHLLIDAEPIAAGEVVPNDEQRRHFGKGQTETTLALSPGEHTLSLQFADGAHVSYGEKLRRTITVQVE
jgi:hypothetical protein